MVVTCSQCATKFKIADDKISATGVKVRCSKCKHTFVVSLGGVSEVDSAVPPPAPSQDSLPNELPDDIFSSPTRVGPPPSASGPAASGPQLLPPPPVGVLGPLPPPKVPSVAQPIDLNSDLPLMAADALPQHARDPLPMPPPRVGPGAAPPKGVAKPPPPPARPPTAAPKATPKPPLAPAAMPPALKAPALPGGGLGDELFTDLDAAVDRSFSPAHGTSAAAASVEDPFAGVEFDAPAAPAAPARRQTAVIPEDPFAGLDSGSPAWLDVPAPVVGIDTDDPFAGLDSVAAPAPVASGSGPDGGDPFERELDPDQGAFSVGPGSDPDDPFAGSDLPQTGQADFFGSIDLEQAPPGGSEVEIAGDDPFGGIDLQAPDPTAGPAGSGAEDPFSQIDIGAAPTERSDGSRAHRAATGPEPDLFGDLGDPFGNLDEGGANAAQPPPLAGAGSMGADLFGPDEIGTSAPAPGQDPSVGHDPFAGLDGADPGADLGLEQGLSLSADGSLAGVESPTGALPTRTIAPAVTQAPPAVVQRPPGPPPMALGSSGEEQASRGTSLGVKIGFGLVLVILALFVFIVYRSGGKPDLTSWSTYVEAFTGLGASEAGHSQLRAVEVGTTAYPNRDGRELVILWGEVENRSGNALESIAVTGQLLDGEGRVAEELTVPAGVRFDPAAVFAMLDKAAVGAAYRTAHQKAARKLESGQRMPFMVVMFEHPSHLDGLRVRITAAPSPDPLAGLPAPAPPPADESGSDDPDLGVEPPALAPPKGPGAKRTGTIVRLKPAAAPEPKPAPKVPVKPPVKKPLEQPGKPLRVP